MADIQDLLARVESVGPLIRSEARAGELAGSVPAVVFDALRERGVLNLVGPSEYGGQNVGPLDAIRVLEAITYHDGSTGWAVMAGQMAGMVLPYVEVETGKILCADGIPLMAGGGAPSGTARRVDGGYVVTGRWSYASGIMHAKYAMAGVQLADESGEPMRDDAGKPELRMILTPVENVTFEGNWDVIGLRGTASIDYSITELFVPEGQVVDVYRGGPKVGGPTMGIAFSGWALLGHVQHALGTARRAIEELAAIGRAPNARRGRLADNTRFRHDYAIAEAKARSARAWILEVWGDIDQTVSTGQLWTTRQQTLAKASLIYSTDISIEIAQLAFTYGGGQTLRNGDAQRVFRDALAGGQHAWVSHDIYDDCARELIGDAEGSTWRREGLVP
ncbi:MAG TPA: acyl-CoA dehydrogenase family protein [Ilumatobacter sp.]|nr:acyl-CoA dehydrogenase family protein [Ilumatobacter sp.]